MPLSDTRVCVGAVLGAHGVRGEVRIKCFTQDPEDIGALGKVETEDGTRQFTLRVTRNVKEGVAASLSGIADRDAAEALKGARLYVHRSALPELAAKDEEYYQADLIGLTVRWQDGSRPDGEIVAVHNFGAGDLIEVALADGKPRTVLLPFNLEIVPEVNIAQRFVTVNPPPEFVDETPAKGESEE